jgi:NADH-quinone oxidoreductase subunit E
VSGDGLPLDPALTTGRAPDRDPERVPELHEVECPPELRERIETLMALYPDKRSASIPALWAVQRRYGWCTPDGIRQAAAVMGVTPAYLESVASFYDLLRTEPAGSHQVLVCTNISCWMRGADALLEAFCEAAGCDPDEAAHGGSVSTDGEVLVSGFECLGACDLAPMASVDERYFGPLGPADAAAVVARLRDAGEVLPEKALARRALAGGAEGDPDERLRDTKGPNR